jgi:hypothetical protein
MGAGVSCGWAAAAGAAVLGAGDFIAFLDFAAGADARALRAGFAAFLIVRIFGLAAFFIVFFFITRFFDVFFDVFLDVFLAMGHPDNTA